MVAVGFGGGARAVARCDVLGVAPYSDTPDGLCRGWLTPAFARTQERVGQWMVEAGMSASLDGASNLVGRYDGAVPGARTLLIGSHLDSVRDAGRYDGPLGVMLGIEVVAALHAAGRRMPFAIEVMGFGDEEGSRFPAAMLTSRAVAGTLDPAMLEVCDGEGLSVVQALADHPALPLPGAGGGPVAEVEEIECRTQPILAARLGPGLRRGVEGKEVAAFLAAGRDPADILGYLEAHIEQGPVLEAEGLSLGIVTGIAAQLRFRVVVVGTAGHAGTTSMPLRRDALAAAAEMVLAAERIAGDAASDLVATVGTLAVAPGAANVVPGRVAFTLDVRSGDAGRRDAAADAILAAFADIARVRGVTVEQAGIHDLPASPCDPHFMDLLVQAVQDQGVPPRRLVSGAGHDAMVLAALCPTAMLFVRCAGGISHNPAEAVDVADVELALGAMRRFVALLGETM